MTKRKYIIHWTRWEMGRPVERIFFCGLSKINDAFSFISNSHEQRDALRFDTIEEAEAMAGKMPIDYGAISISVVYN